MINLSPPKFIDFKRNEIKYYRFIMFVAVIFLFRYLINSYKENSEINKTEIEFLKEQLETEKKNNQKLLKKNDVLQIQINKLINVINTNSYENRGTTNINGIDSLIWVQ